LPLRTPLPRATALRRLLSRWKARPGLPAALLAHAGLFALAVWLIPEPQPRERTTAEPVEIELLSAEQFAALTSPRVAPEEAPAAPAVPPPKQTPPPLVAKPRALAHAATILSGRLGPEVRRSLVAMAVDTRFEQICGVEALEQIAKSRHDLKPRRAVAYATADTRVTGNVMVADGAAFFSEGKWFGLAFRCETTPDRLKVMSFDFAIGAPVTSGEGLDAGEDED